MRFFFCLSVFLLLFAVTVRASSIPAENPAERLVEDRLLERQREALSKPVPAIPKTNTLPNVDESASCYRLKRIELMGNTKLKPEVINAITSPHQERGCVRVGDIQTMLTAFNNAYQAQGFVGSKVIWRDNDLRDEILTFNAVEARLESVMLERDAEPFWTWRNDLGAFTAFPFLTGKIAHQDNIAIGLAQINRLSSSHATTHLIPGEKPGHSKLIVKDTQKDWFRATLSTDNLGQTSTGRTRYSLLLEADNLLGLNDSWLVSGVTADRSDSFSTSFSVPFGRWRYQFDASLSDYKIPITGTSTLFGESESFTHTLRRYMFLEGRDRLESYISLNVRDSGRVLNDITLTPQPLTIAGFGINGRIQVTPQTSITGDIAFYKGLEAFGATKDDDNLPADAPRAQFTKFEATTALTSVLTDFGYLSSQISGQYAWEALYGAAQLSLGDNYTVRGYKGGVALGDIGLYSRNEMTFFWSEPFQQRLGEVGQAVTKAIQPFAFVDMGAVRVETSQDWQSLSGAGVGARFTWKRFSGNVTIAKPLAASQGLRDDDVLIYARFNVQVW